MENPLELPAPEDPIQQVHDLARDLAYGAIHNIWAAEISVIMFGASEHWAAFSRGVEDSEVYPILKYLDQKWKNQQPSARLLLSFGYFLLIRQSEDSDFYLLTEKAFALLQKPATPPSVFISYRQVESSALGLLIESRLKLVDSNINVFIDKLIEPSEDLRERIHQAILQCRYFVCLLGPTTLENSPMVKEEIALARRLKRTVFPICHNGYKVDDNYRALLDDTKAFVIEPESAEEYELAMIKLLNGMGYSNL
jgi:hypothetical protein